MTIDWRSLPAMMRCSDLQRHVYTAYSLMGLRKLVQRRSPKVPTPCSQRPYVFRREDVRRHFERLEA